MASQVEKSAFFGETISVDDFVFLKSIAEGSFGTVFLAKNIHDHQEYAVKVLDKVDMRRNRIFHQIDIEEEALNILSGCPNHFIQMYGTTHDFDFVYFVLHFAKNGSLFALLHESDSFNFCAAKYYAAEILLGLEVLHSRGIIHRDLKPENILLDENWHIRLADFGLAKIVHKKENKANIAKRCTRGVIGTMEYVSPEVISRQEAVFASDLWAYGCVVYQMISGRRLFDGGDEVTTFQMIQKLDYDFPSGFDADAKDLVQNLLVLQPELRLGALDSKPYESIRNHTFFCNVDWNNIGEPPKTASSSKDCSKSKDGYYNTEPGFNYQILARLLHF